MYSKYFDVSMRPSGTKYYVLTEDAPEKLKDAIQRVHHWFGALPDDYIYETIYNIICRLDDGETYDDIFDNPNEPFAWKDLLDWLHAPGAIDAVDDALMEYRPEKFFDLLQFAYADWYREILNIVYDKLYRE